MAKIYETGHAKNVANFEDLIAFCNGFGAKYNPVKESLKVANLLLQFNAAKTALADIKVAQTNFNNATNQRILVFKSIKSLGTKLVNSLGASDASVETLKDAKTINRKLQGQRASSKTEKKVPEDGAGAGMADARSISASQQSYDQLVEHFARLVQLLASEPSYKPNEDELKVLANQEKLNQMRSANSNVVNMYTKWSNSILVRNNILYNPFTGLVATAMDVKKYIKAVFGASAPQYKQVSGLEFRMRVS